MSNLVEQLLDENHRYVQEYTSSAATLERRQWRARRPVKVVIVKCMDERVHFANATGIPKGVVTLIRNMGGIVDLGWPAFNEFIRGWDAYANEMRRKRLVVVTYHFARGDKYRGCKGFEYETRRAEEFAENLRLEFANDFGTEEDNFSVIKMGIETDLNALILHGWDGARIDLAEVGAEGVDLEDIYPGMPQKICETIGTFVRGNLAYLKKGERRSILETEHSGSVLAVGRGFEWVENGKALIVGPFNPNLKAPIVTAGKILLENLMAGKIEEVVLLTAGEHRSQFEFSERLAARKANYLRGLAFSVLEEEVSELLPHLSVLSGTVYMDTRELRVTHRS